jgi:type I restriction enzyme S subunit
MRLLSGYYRHLFKSKILIEQLENLTDQLRDGQTINYPRFARMVLPVPPLEAQKRITDYLDRETSEIDAMLGKLDDLAQQLVIRRDHSIEEVLRPDSRSCRPTPLFALASSEDNRRIPLKAEDRSKLPGAHPYYGASGVIDNIESFIWDNETRLLVSEDGANLVARRHPIAFVASGQYWVNNHAHVLRAHDAVDSRLIAYAIAITDINHAITGSAQPKLTAEALWRLKIPFPVDLATSASMADHLDEVTGRIDAMLAKVAELKSLLIERRAALITDVVTGKKEIA